MTQWLIGRDASGAVDYSLEFCDSNQYIELTASTESTLAVPTTLNYSKFRAVFGYTPGGSVWVSNGDATLTLPTTSFTATEAQLNPPVRTVNRGETLHFISGDTGTCVGVSFYGVS